MKNRYAPLILPTVLNQIPADYNKSIKQFGGDDDYTTKQHVQWFKYYCELNEIDHEDVQMRLFAQSLRTNVKEWFRALDPDTIQSMNRFVTIFLDKWEKKKYFV